MSTSVLSLYRRITRWPAGHWIFSRLICLKAPYFTTIAPRFVTLQPGRCEVRIRDRRRVHNHIGTVHAIALCNLAELAAGMMAEATVPADMRWIPKGMEVDYAAKATTDITCVATTDPADWTRTGDVEVPVPVVATRADGTAVVEGTIRLWVTDKPTR